MKQSLFDPAVSATMIARIEALTPTSPALWGRMNVAQMLAHCDVPMQVAHGDLKIKRGLIGFLFGKMVLRQYLSDAPLSHNSPTFKEAIIPSDVSFEVSRAKLIARVERFQKDGPDGIVKDPHPFFGKMTTDQWAILQVKHLDHHLQQFGV